MVRYLAPTAMAVVAVALSGCGGGGAGNGSSSSASTASTTSGTSVGTTTSSSKTGIGSTGAGTGSTGTGTGSTGKGTGSTGIGTGSTGTGSTGTGSTGTGVNPGGPIITASPSPSPSPGTGTSTAPAISSMNPTTGVAGTTAVSIVVTNFAGATAVVDFNGVAAGTPTYAGLNGAVTVTVTVPATATTGDVHVTITPAGGGTPVVLDAGAFTVTAGSTGTTATPPTGPGFSAGAALVEVRGAHTATLLQDGRVLVVGGVDLETNPNSGGMLAESEIYDPLTNTFTLANDPSLGGIPGGYMVDATGVSPTYRMQHTATLLTDGRVLIAGGFGFDTFTGGASNPQPIAAQANGADLATAYLFDPKTNTFAATGSLNNARSGHYAVLLDTGKVLIAGGYNGTLNGGQGGMLDSGEVFDPTAGTFTALAASNTMQTGPRADGAAANAGTFALFVGGDAILTYAQTGDTPPSGTATSAVEGDYYIGGDEAFDFQSATFVPMYVDQPTNDIRLLCTLDLATDPKTSSQYLYLAGGIGGSSQGSSTTTPGVTDIEQFDLTQLVWNTVAQLQTGRMNQSSAASGGDMLWSGGASLDASGNVTGTLASGEYLASGGTTTQVFQMAQGRNGAASVALPNGSVLVTGGFENGQTDPWGLDGTSVQGPAEIFTKP